MNKIPGKILVSMMLSGVLISGFAIPAMADNVVTVSSLPSSTSAYTTSNSQNKSFAAIGVEPGSEVASGKAVTPVITAAVNVQTAETITTQNVSSASSSESSKVTIPVINAADTIEASNTKKAAANEEKTEAVSTEKIGVVDATLGNISLSSQAVAATEVGYCVILSSSPTGLMTDL